MDRAGAETMVMNLYRQMDREKIQFDFIVFSKEAGDYDEEINTLGGNVFQIIANNPIERVFKLKNFLEQHPEYKVIHSHTLLSSGFHLLAGKLANIPFRIAHAHSTNDNFKSKFIGKIYQFFTKQLIKKYATHFVACGKEAGDFLFETHKKVLFLPNAINTEQFAEIGEGNKDYWQKNFQIDKKTLKIIQVGRLMPVKNTSFTLKLAEYLRNSNIDFKIFFVGQGPLLNDLEIGIKKRELGVNVVLLGMRKDIPQLMAGADALIMPSFHEGFPVVLVESQAVGLPALISDTISAEVDLGMGLVDFMPLVTEIEKWAEKLNVMKQNQNLSIENRLDILNLKGFDIKTNSEMLLKLYNSLN